MSSDDLNANELNSMISFHSWSLAKSSDEQRGTTLQSTTMPEINFHTIKYSDKSLYVWIGDSSSKMQNLACSMQSPLERDPIGVEIMQSASLVDGGGDGNLSKDMAVKLSKRLRKQVLVSFNVSPNLLELLLVEGNQSDEVTSLLHLIEKSLFAEIKSKPELF